AKQMRSGKGAQAMLEGVMNMPSEINEASLSFPMQSIEDEEAAKRAYESTLRRVTEGIERTVKVQDKEHSVSFQADYEPVQGVGDEAAWSNKHRQITVRAGKVIYHVRVNIEQEAPANRSLAMTLAKALI